MEICYFSKLHKNPVCSEAYFSKALYCNKQKLGFIKQVDNGWITTVKDLESWRFER